MQAPNSGSTIALTISGHAALARLPSAHNCDLRSKNSALPSLLPASSLTLTHARHHELDRVSTPYNRGAQYLTSSFLRFKKGISRAGTSVMPSRS